MLNVFLLGLTSLLSDFSSEMVLPILPFFIQSVGGTGIAIGLVFGIGDAMASIFKVISGYEADKTRQYKRYVWGGYLFSALAKFAYPLAGSWNQIAIIRPIERVGKGFRDAPRDAIVSESLNENERGRGFGIQRAMDSTGAIIGSAFVLILFIFYNVPFPRIFFISALIGVVAVIPIFFVKVPEHLKLKHKSVSFRRLSTKARRFIVVATIFAFANFSYAFFILRAQATFIGLSEKASLGLALVAYIFLNIIDASFSLPAGMLSDRIGRRRVILISYLMFSLVSLGFFGLSITHHSNSVDFALLIVLFAIYGLFKAFVDASQKAFVSDLSDIDIRGTALGTFDTITGLAAIPAGLIAGYLWNFDPAYTFAYGAILSFIAAAGLLSAIRN